MTGTKRVGQRVWAAGCVLVACLNLAACPDGPKNDRVWTPPTGPTAVSLTVAVRGTVQDFSGAPIAGAQVSATTSLSGTVTGTSDANGRFDLGSVEAIGWQVRIDIGRNGYLPLSVSVNSASAVIDAPFKLRPLESLPVDGSLTANLLPTDPPEWIGEAYDGDYVSNARFYTFTAHGNDAVVDLDWDHTLTPVLQMWVMDGWLVSQGSGTHEMLKLPRGQSGILLVGKPSSGSLTAPVRFTLTVK